MKIVKNKIVKTIINNIVLFFQLVKYFEKKYQSGRGIRWMIADETGESVYCKDCGNMANGGLQIKKFGSTFNMPYCKSHIEKILDIDKPGHDGFVLPSIIQIENADLVTTQKLSKDYRW